MANTTVLFTTDEGEILANFNWLALTPGDTLTFEAPAGGPRPVLFFSPALVRILTPTPPESLTVGDAATTTFTVTGAQPGSYTILVGTSPDLSPFFPDRESTNLFFESMPAMVGAPSPVDPPPHSGN